MADVINLNLTPRPRSTIEQAVLALLDDATPPGYKLTPAQVNQVVSNCIAAASHWQAGAALTVQTSMRIPAGPALNEAQLDAICQQVQSVGQRAVSQVLNNVLAERVFLEAQRALRLATT